MGGRHRCRGKTGLHSRYTCPPETLISNLWQNVAFFLIGYGLFILSYQHQAVAVCSKLLTGSYLWLLAGRRRTKNDGHKEVRSVISMSFINRQVQITLHKILINITLVSELFQLFFNDTSRIRTYQ